MSLRVIGAGMGRTGTLSLKVALEQLLEAPCYHMTEVFRNPDHIPVWHEAARGRCPDWAPFFEGWAAAVDEPSAAFWPELTRAFPDALVVLSVRDAESWWQSASETVFKIIGGPPPVEPPFMSQWHAMINEIMARRYPGMLTDHDTAIQQFEAHNDQVRTTVPADRLLEWHPTDGWGPLCAALGVAVPAEPFPHANTRADFLARTTAGGPAH